jgi:uncharacterized protein
VREFLRSAKGAARTSIPVRNCFAPRSGLREFLRDLRPPGRTADNRWKRFMRRLRVYNPSRSTTLADRALIADSSKTRKTGLLKHDRLESGEGLWIKPCEAVHTVGMKFPIDVLFLDKKRKVVKIRPSMPRWRMAACFWAHSVLELPSGMAAATNTSRGDQLEFETYEN